MSAADAEKGRSDDFISELVRRKWDRHLETAF